MDIKNPETTDLKAPDKFRTKFKTTKGDVTLEINRDWSANGADRFYNLVKAGFFTDIAFFRVIEGFMAQFGIHGDPDVSGAWENQIIKDDEVNASNTRGRISFATAGPDTRTTQLFINFGDNSFLDDQGFSPIGEVVEGMENIDALYKEYGEGAPHGKGPSQGYIHRAGNAYLKENFPELDYILSAEII